LDALALVGALRFDEHRRCLFFKQESGESSIWMEFEGGEDFDPYACVLTLNLHRRHLTPEQKRDLIDVVLKAKPDLSNRQIGKLTKTDHHKVSDRRNSLESTGEISPVEKTVGADGKKRKQAAKKAKPITSSPAPEDNQDATIELIIRLFKQLDHAGRDKVQDKINKIRNAEADWEEDVASRPDCPTAAE
jgi:hypothetical protein